MKTEKTRCSLCAMLATLSAITSVTTLFFLYTTSLNQGPSRTKTIMRHSHAFEPLLKSAAIGVLLQQSQVQVHEQPTRLRTIDSSWASWLHTKGSELPIKVYAAVPKEWHANEDFRLHHLHTVSMLADSSPYHNMINSLFRVISDSTVGNLKWLVMANDHSFIVPPNLRKFLQGLDADVLAYSGNELKMVYKKRILSFASGGAGAVMSHTVVKLMLAVWVATGWDDSIFAFQNGSTSAGPSSIGEMGSCSPDSILLDMRDTGAVISMGLAFLHQWMLGLASEQALKALQRSVCGDGHDADRFRRQQLVLRMSPKVRLVFAKPTSSTPSSQQKKQQQWYTVTLVRTGGQAEVAHEAQELQRECTAHDKWERTNPGIILAHCLGHVFGVNFTSSTSTNTYRPSIPGEHPSRTDSPLPAERFNVYGVLRLLVGDYDSWYLDAKRSTETENNSTSSGATSDLATSSQPQAPITLLATDVVSFHYVSQVEAQLLYELLSTRRPSPTAAFSAVQEKENGRKNHEVLPICHPDPTHISTSNCFRAREIHALWPATSKDAGHYSRPLSKGPASFHEADLLYEYLSRVTIAE